MPCELCWVKVLSLLAPKITYATVLISLMLKINSYKLRLFLVELTGTFGSLNN